MAQATGLHNHPLPSLAHHPGARAWLGRSVGNSKGCVFSILFFACRQSEASKEGCLSRVDLHDCLHLVSRARPIIQRQTP
jgi:hypothetical protein